MIFFFSSLSLHLSSPPLCCHFFHEFPLILHRTLTFVALFNCKETKNGHNDTRIHNKLHPLNSVIMVDVLLYTIFNRGRHHKKKITRWTYIMYFQIIVGEIVGVVYNRKDFRCAHVIYWFMCCHKSWNRQKKI